LGYTVSAAARSRARKGAGQGEETANEFLMPMITVGQLESFRLVVIATSRTMFCMSI
jgi:hypothetical protein